MANEERISAGQTVFWGLLGLGTGVVAGAAFGAWIGDVNRRRIGRAAERLQQPTGRPMTSGAIARAAAAAILAERRLAGLGLDVVSAGRSAVELRGWVTDRATRAVAVRVARAVPGVGNVINNLLVRGEDDLPLPSWTTAQSPA